MNIVVWKYEVHSYGVSIIYMPLDAKILKFDIQQGDVVMWALIDEDSTPVKRQFENFNTGQRLEPTPFDLTYLGTTQYEHPGGPIEVHHIFERRINS